MQKNSAVQSSYLLPATLPEASQAGHLAGRSPPERPALSLKDQQERWKAARARMGAPLTPIAPVVKREAKVIGLPVSQKAAREQDIEWFYHGLTGPVVPYRAESRQIIRETALEFKLHPDELIGDSRESQVVFARYVAIHRIARAYPQKSSTQIGKLFNRDHTSILFALGRMKKKPLRLAKVRAAV